MPFLKEERSTGLKNSKEGEGRAEKKGENNTSEGRRARKGSEDGKSCSLRRVP
jgi:hypothetical protein